jgi:hypothetical protein
MRLSSLSFILQRNKKKWNSVFAIVDIPCNFQQNLPKEMAIGLNGLRLHANCPQSSSYPQSLLNPFFRDVFKWRLQYFFSHAKERTKMQRR